MWPIGIYHSLMPPQDCHASYNNLFSHSCLKASTNSSNSALLASLSTAINLNFMMNLFPTILFDIIIQLLHHLDNTLDWKTLIHWKQVNWEIFRSSYPILPCTYMTSHNNRPLGGKWEASHLATSELWSSFFSWSCMDYFCILFATCAQTPWWVNTKFFTSKAFHVIMSHFLPIRQDDFNFLSYVHAQALVGAGCLTSWKSNISLSKGECSLLESDSFT